jgi:hypothetical protein
VRLERGRFRGTDFEATYNAASDKFSYVFMPALLAGQIPQPSLETTGELLIKGVIEPDADGDGFGDETQDRCPTQRTTQGRATRPRRPSPGSGSMLGASSTRSPRGRRSTSGWR